MADRFEQTAAEARERLAQARAGSTRAQERTERAVARHRPVAG
jgi:hypothetical protein